MHWGGGTLTVSAETPDNITILLPPTLETTGGASIVFQEGLAGFYKDHKWGFIDTTGTLVIPIEYDRIESFTEGLAAVKKDDKWGFIDKTGTFVIPLEYDWAHSFTEGLALVEKDGKVGLIDKNGTLVIPIGEYDNIFRFQEELLIVFKGHNCGLIDKSNSILIPVGLYDALERTGEGRIVFFNVGGKWGIIEVGDVVGIDYSSKDIIVSGSTAGFSINLTEEIFVGTTTDIKSFSIDGGTKWKNVKSDTFSKEKFPKLLNKDLTLWLSDKVPVKKDMPDDATIVKFPTINKRSPTPKLVVNYEIAADSSGKTAGEWVLTKKGETTAEKSNIEIGVAKGKVVDEKGYGKFFATGGISVIKLTGAKPIKTTYFFRTAPKQEGTTYTAASKAKKIKVTSELKSSSYKVKNDAIKVKKNTSVSINGGTPTSYADKFDLDIKGITGTIELWSNATAKKPASKKQTYNLK